MAPPRSVTKVTRNGVEFTSNVDRAQYTITELVRAALRDSAKVIRRRSLDKARKLPGLRRGKRPLNAFQYWLRKREGDLLVGIKHGTWYGVDQELGTNLQPKRGILKNSVYDNIDIIRQAQAQYLSAIENENSAFALIDEEESVGEDE